MQPYRTIRVRKHYRIPTRRIERSGFTLSFPHTRERGRAVNQLAIQLDLHFDGATNDDGIYTMKGQVKLEDFDALLANLGETTHDAR